MRQKKTCLSKRHPVCLSLCSNMAFHFPKAFIAKVERIHAAMVGEPIVNHGITKMKQPTGMIMFPGDD